MNAKEILASEPLQAKAEELEKAKMDRRIDLQLRVLQGDELTRDEMIELNGWEDGVPELPVSKKTYKLREVMGQLTRTELNAKVKHDNKMEKINDGMEKIYALVNRGIAACR